MALDTRDKRASALGRSLLCLTLYPLADGTIGALDPQHAGGQYRLTAVAAFKAIWAKVSNSVLQWRRHDSWVG